MRVSTQRQNKEVLTPGQAPDPGVALEDSLCTS